MKTITLFMFLFVCELSVALRRKRNDEEKTTYIVHMAKSEMPSSFNHHSHWYEATLRLVSTSADIIYSYEKAIHGFTTSLTAEEARLLSSQAGILKVSQDKKYNLFATRTPEFLGLDRCQVLSKGL